MAIVILVQPTQFPTGTWVPMQMAETCAWGQYTAQLPPPGQFVGVMHQQISPAVPMTGNGGCDESDAGSPQQKNVHRGGGRGHRRQNSVWSNSSSGTSQASESAEASLGSTSDDDDDQDDDDTAQLALLESLDAGGEGRTAALEALRGTIRVLAFNKAGCRVVQKALEVADKRDAAALALELKGTIRKAVRCPHANYVIQKIVEVLPASSAGFVAQELRGTAAIVARHSYGCRVLCRLTEYHASENNRRLSAVINEILMDASELSRHAFGHHVVQAILEHGTQQQRSNIAATLSRDAMNFARHRSACYVMEKALVYCAPADQRLLAVKLLSQPEHLPSLADQFGCRVAKALLRVSGDVSIQVQTHLLAAGPQLQKSKYGRRLLDECSRRSQEA